MLSHIFTRLPHLFTQCDVVPRMLYSKLPYWKKKDNSIVATNIVSAYIDNKDFLFDITRSSDFDLLSLINSSTGISIDELVKVLNVYKPTKEECAKILNTYISSRNIVTVDVYDAVIQHYPELSKLITQDNIHRTFVHHKFKHLQVRQFEDYFMIEMLHSSIEEFLYVYPTQEEIVALSALDVIKVDIRILTMLLDTVSPELYPIAYWRLHNKFPHMSDIINFTTAYYVRKYDPELYKKLDKDISDVDMDWILTIDTSTDLEVMLDVLAESYDCVGLSLIDMIRDSDQNSHINHWLSTVIYLSRAPHVYDVVHLDDCNACKHFMSKITI